MTIEIASVAAILGDISTELLTEFEEARREYTIAHDDEHSIGHFGIEIRNRAEQLSNAADLDDEEHLKAIVCIAVGALLKIRRQSDVEPQFP